MTVARGYRRTGEIELLKILNSRVPPTTAGEQRKLNQTASFATYYELTNFNYNCNKGRNFSGRVGITAWVRAKGRTGGRGE